MNFLLHGSIAYDQLLQYDGEFTDLIKANALDRLSASFFSPHFAKQLGGTASNIGWNVQLLGGQAFPVGAVGSDGDEIMNHLRGAGVHLDYITTNNDHVTATAIIGTDTQERQLAFFHPGADAVAELPTIEDPSRFTFACISARNPSLMLSGAAQCKKLGINYIFDPGQQSAAFGRDEYRDAIHGSSALVTNEYEWELAKQKLEWQEKDVVDACGALIVTQGSEGVDVITHEGKTRIEACKAKKVVNPTGAGDAFRAGLLVGLGHEWQLLDACKLGAAAASFIVEEEGAMLPSLDPKTVADRAQKTYGEVLPTF